MNLPLTNKANDIIAESYELAMNKSHSQCTPVHVVSCLLQDADQFTKRIISKASGANQTGGNENNSGPSYQFGENIRVALSKIPSQSPPPETMDASSSLRSCIRQASTEAKKNGDTHVAIDHLLLSLLKDSSIIPLLGSIKLKDVEQAVASMRSNKKVDSAAAESSYDALNKVHITFTINTIHTYDLLI